MTKYMLWNDGEGLEHEDLQRVITQQVQRESLVPLQAIADMNDWGSGQIPPFMGMAAGVALTFGWGLTVNTSTASLTVSLASGPVFAAWLDSNVDSPEVDEDTIKGRLFWITGQNIVLAANASGSTRYDKISIPADDATALTEGDSESRDFKDAVTGALTSTATDKRIALPTSVTVTQGTPGAGVPATPTGHVALFAIEIPTGAAGIAGPSQITDYTQPFARGGVHTEVTLGKDVLATGAWGVVAGQTNSNSTGTTPGKFLPPAGLLGNPAAKLIGVVIHHSADESFTADIIRHQLWGGADTVLHNLAPIGTTDGQQRTVWDTLGATVWGNGYAGGRSAWLAGVQFGASGTPLHPSTVALEITPSSGAGTSVVIHAITWIYAA